MGTINEFWVEWRKGDGEMTRWLESDLEREMLDSDEEPYRVIHIWREVGDPEDKIAFVQFNLRALQDQARSDERHYRRRQA